MFLLPPKQIIVTSCSLKEHLKPQISISILVCFIMLGAQFCLFSNFVHLFFFVKVFGF